MKNKKSITYLANDTNSSQKALQAQIQTLQLELAQIEHKTQTFEALLHTHVSELIIESQELFTLYKQIKKAKKAKRLEQKKRGKNYKAPKTPPPITESNESKAPVEEQKEKRRLYREAMLHVHPDKFSMSEKETEIANEITSKLIEIYQTESLEKLQAYHAHIFSGNTQIALGDFATEIKTTSEDDYLKQEKERLEKDLDSAKNAHIYSVMMEYTDPMTFVEELKEYYEDRIAKLKKRTRKGL